MARKQGGDHLCERKRKRNSMIFLALFKFTKIYTKYIKMHNIYTRYIQDNRRRGGPARPGPEAPRCPTRHEAPKNTDTHTHTLTLIYTANLQMVKKNTNRERQQANTNLPSSVCVRPACPRGVTRLAGMQQVGEILKRDGLHRVAKSLKCPIWTPRCSKFQTPKTYCERYLWKSAIAGFKSTTIHCRARWLRLPYTRIIQDVMAIYIHLSLYIYIYVCLYIPIYIHRVRDTYIYIYIYIYTYQKGPKPPGRAGPAGPGRQATQPPSILYIYIYIYIYCILLYIILCMLYIFLYNML